MSQVASCGYEASALWCGIIIQTCTFAMHVCIQRSCVQHGVLEVVATTQPA
jgi:hypothetical protein